MAPEKPSTLRTNPCSQIDGSWLAMAGDGHLFSGAAGGEQGPTPKSDFARRPAALEWRRAAGAAGGNGTLPGLAKEARSPCAGEEPP